MCQTAMNIAATVGLGTKPWIPGTGMLSSVVSTTTWSGEPVQSAGKGFRLSAHRVKDASNHSHPVMHLLLRYTQALIGNLLVALAKADMAAWTSSSAMLSEAVHAFVHIGNRP